MALEAVPGFCTCFLAEWASREGWVAGEEGMVRCVRCPAGPVLAQLFWGWGPGLGGRGRRWS